MHLRERSRFFDMHAYVISHGKGYSFGCAPSNQSSSSALIPITISQPPYMVQTSDTREDSGLAIKRGMGYRRSIGALYPLISEARFAPTFTAHDSKTPCLVMLSENDA